jgi:Fanconi anemia group M protein
MKLDTEKLQLRLYQQTILNTAAKHNTLVVLPTGLGKTHIAIALAALYASKGKVLMMAPTVPLVKQHYDNFKEFFSPSNDIVMLTGEIEAEERIKLWNSAGIVLATPQTIRFDIIAGRISLDLVSLVVFDEAHRAVGDYAYVFIGQACGRSAKGTRILGLTASPGNSETADEICRNLFIEKVEARDREHEEVEPYVRPIHTNFVLLDLPSSLAEIRLRLDQAITARSASLKRLGVNMPAKLTRKALLALNNELRQKFLRDKRFGLSLSICTSLIKLQHAHALLTTESLTALNRYFENLWNSSTTSKTKSIKDLVNDINVKSAFSLATRSLEAGIEHPKLDAVKFAVERQLEDKADSKILVFTEFRDNVPAIMAVLEKVPSASTNRFIGQAARMEKGMSQKMQAEVLDRFREGELNVLVCTSVGEEGIDIPDVDLVIFYSPLPSTIRTIQRRGRTGRTSLGKVLMLITKNTRDEAYYWSAKKNEEKLNLTIRDMQANVKQVSLDKYPAKIDQNVDIFVDNRENELAEILHAKGCRINLGQLKAGDFILSEDVGCERKAIEDFVTSLLDGRLFEQAKNLKESFAKPVIILEGDYNLLFAVRNVSPSAIMGALASLVLDWGIPLIVTKNKEETADLLITIAKREQLDKNKKVSIRGSHKPQLLPEMQQYFIEGLPQIGPEAAKALLKHFGNPKNMVVAEKDELKKVEGIGDKKAELIRKLLDTEFKD